MARFERPQGGRDSNGSSGRGFSRDRSSSRGGFGRDNFQKTKVICSKCGVECEVPFKPTSNKPVYCDACFGRNDSGDHHNHSAAPSPAIPSRDLDIINEKLSKIIKALEIE